MLALKDLINQIAPPELRSKVRQEVDRILGHKKFGNVFEDHLLESVLLPEAPIRRGSHVALCTDNLPKAKGMAEYAKMNTNIGRIKLIHCKSNGDFVRLGLARSIVQEKIKLAHNHASISNNWD